MGNNRAKRKSGGELLPAVAQCAAAGLPVFLFGDYPWNQLAASEAPLDDRITLGTRGTDRKHLQRRDGILLSGADGSVSDQVFE